MEEDVRILVLTLLLARIEPSEPLMTFTLAPSARRGLLIALFCAVTGLLLAQSEGGAGVPGDDPFEARRAAAVVDGLEERSRLVGLLLLDVSRDYRQVAVEKSSVLQQLVDAQSELDRGAVRVRDLTLEQLDVLRGRVRTLRERYLGLTADSDRLLESLRLLLTEKDVVERRVAELRSRMPMSGEVLSGVWEVTWLPSGKTGTFYLDQSGTLVTGQYRLGSQRSGSLRGTFVGNKLYLERVDSQRGRDAEIEGFLDADGTRIKGTWQAYELVQGGLPHGQWVARRVK